MTKEEFKKYEEQIKKLYEELDFVNDDEESINQDIMHSYLTINVGLTDNQTYIWYYDGFKDVAINTKTNEILRDEETNILIH